MANMPSLLLVLLMLIVYYWKTTVMAANCASCSTAVVLYGNMYISPQESHNYVITLRSFVGSHKVEVNGNIVHGTPPEDVVSVSQAGPLQLLPGQRRMLNFTFDGLEARNDYYLKINAASSDGKAKEFVRFYPLAYYDADIRILLIQLNQPYFRPKDTVTVRVLVLNDKLHAINTEPPSPLKLQFIDPKGDIKHTISDLEPKYANFSGFYESQFQLFPMAMTGTWSVSASLGNHQKTSTFNVDDYELPIFETIIHGPKHIVLTSNRAVTLNVQARFPTGKPVRGHVNISTASGILQKGTFELVNGNAEATLKLHEGNPYCQQNNLGPFTFNVSAIVREHSSGQTMETITVVNLLCGNFVIDIVGMDEQRFTPYMPFSVKFSLIRQDTSLASEIRCSVTVRRSVKTYYVDDTELPNREFSLNLDHSEHVFQVPPISNDTRSIKVIANCDIGKFEKLFRCHESSKNGKFIKIDSKSPRFANVSEDVNLKVICGDDCAEVDYLVIGKNGVIRQGKVDDTWTIKLTVDASVDLIVYTVVGNSFTTETRMASLEIIVETESSVSLDTVKMEVQLPPGKEYYSPGVNESARVIVQSKPHSLVALLAVDKRLLQKGNSHEISADEIMKEYYDAQIHHSSLKNALHLLADREVWSSSHGFTNSVVTAIFKDLELLFDCMVFPSITSSVDDIPSKIIPRPIIKRSDFSESFLIQTAFTNDTGYAEFTEKVPDSITGWSLSAISIHTQHVIGMLKNKKVAVYQPLFLQPVMPNSVILGEESNMTIFIHNQHNDTRRIRISMTIKMGLPNWGHSMIKRELEANVETGSVVKKNIQWRPNRIGVANITFILSNRVNGEWTQEDEVFMQREVKGEGSKSFSEPNPFKVFATPDRPTDVKTTTKTIRSLVADNGFMRNTEMAQLVCYDDPWTPVHKAMSKGGISNFPGYSPIATACSEQNLQSFIPNVHWANRLKLLKELTPELQKGLVMKIQEGYKYQLAYRNPDFSYCWGSKPGPSSTFVTALVARALKAAIKFTDLDNVGLEETITLLDRFLSQEGCFTDPGTGHYFVYHKQPIPLTATILLTYLDLDKSKSPSVTRALNYLAEQLNIGISDPLDLAVTALALLKANHPSGPLALRKLNAIATVSPNMILWETSGTGRSIQATSYALMANLLQPDEQFILSILNYFWSQMDTNGFFKSTLDTLLALEALSSVQQVVTEGERNVKLRIYPVLVDENITHAEVYLTSQNRQQKHEFPLSLSEDKVTVEVSGVGAALCQINYQYYKRLKNTKEIPTKRRKRALTTGESNKHFALRYVLHIDEMSKEINLKVCFRYMGQDEHSGYTMLVVDAITGYRFDPNLRIKARGANKKVMNVELIGGAAYLHLTGFRRMEECISFVLYLISEPVPNPATRLIRIYKYYEPSELNEMEYSIQTR